MFFKMWECDHPTAAAIALMGGSGRELCHVKRTSASDARSFGEGVSAMQHQDLDHRTEGRAKAPVLFGQNRELSGEPAALGGVAASSSFE